VVDIDITRYIGIPYSSLDCWGLVKLFYIEQFDIKLQTYYDSPPRNKEIQSAIIQSNLGDFLKTDKPKFGDIVLIKLLGVPSHVGIYIDKANFLHTNEKVNSVLDKFSKWGKSIDSFYTVK
jgi:cell wall-associated NlpC family hydrolase